MLYTICIALILVASVLVILAVLVQNPKSGMAANFGASNQVMGVRETTNFLEKFTALQERDIESEAAATMPQAEIPSAGQTEQQAE